MFTNPAVTQKHSIFTPCEKHCIFTLCENAVLLYTVLLVGAVTPMLDQYIFHTSH